MKRIVRILPVALIEFQSLPSLHRPGARDDQAMMKRAYLDAIQWHLRDRGTAWPGAQSVSEIPGLVRIRIYDRIVMSVIVQRAGFWRWKTETITIVRFVEEPG